jgi:hypothetical protein
LHIPRRVFVKEDYDLASIVFMANKQEVHQLWLNEVDIAGMLKSQASDCKLEVSFSCSHLPDAWRLSLHSASSGWEKNVKGRMPYFIAGLGNFAIKKCHVL